MLSSMSSNAILAKARTMCGRRLTDKDYEDLLACKTVPEVANYLKNETVYSEILSGLNENDVHRGQLETLLRKKIFYEKVSLARFDMNSEKFLSVFFINRMEIEQIMRCISLLNIGRASEYAYEMPVFFEKHTNLNLKSFSEVTNLSELCDVLSNTKYAKIIRPFIPQGDEQLDVPKIETALYTYNFNSLFESINKNTRGKEKKELLALINAFIDFRNFVRISRLKMSYHTSEDYTRSMLLPYGRLSKAQINSLLECESSNELMNNLKATYIGKSLNKAEYNTQSQMITALNSIYCKKNIRLSVNASVVMLSYVMLSEIELSNIINLIEGTRYGFSEEEKSRLLVR